MLCCTLTRAFSESAPLLCRWGYVINGTCRATVLEQGKLRWVDTWVRPILHVLSRQQLGGTCEATSLCMSYVVV